jgi:protein SCO1
MKRLAIATTLLLTLFALVSCTKSSNQTAAPAVQRYHLKGKVVSVDKRANMLNVDSEAIPGFMDAMTMPYEVKPASAMDKLSPGDAITADVVVQGDNSWLENIVVTRHSAPPTK